MTEVVCFSCQKKVPTFGSVGRRDECPFCKADLHVCKNCAHYDKTAYNECREPVAGVVLEKDRANFCDHFVPGQGAGAAGKSAQDLRAAAEALFKKK